MESIQIYDSHHKIAISRDILNKLPGWFGIPQAKDDYIRYSSEMPFFAIYCGSQAVGFISIKSNSRYSAEIYVMGVHPDYHRKGIGSALVKSAFKWCKDNGYEFLQVKTLDESHPDINYEGTRKFYESMGFRPLECIPHLWDKDNPCLIMIIHI